MVQAVLTPNLVELVKRESKDCAERSRSLSCWLYYLGDNGVPFLVQSTDSLLFSRDVPKPGVSC